MEDPAEDSARVRAWLIGVSIGALVLAAMLVSFEIGSNQTEEQAVVAKPGPAKEVPPPPQPAEGPGKDLFVASCGGCHTLSEAGTAGAAGPNLDDLMPDNAQVLSAIEIGGAGSGAMPAGLLTGDDAVAVSDYVASVAGG